MPLSTENLAELEPQYVGWRLSADEYFELEDDGFRYELIDGVMVMSPSPMLPHQGIIVHLLARLTEFLRDHPVGRVYPDVDVKLTRTLVYRPDIVFVRAERLRRGLKRLNVVPDLVVEIVSRSSRVRDRREKKADYERFGVQEYWVIDTEGDRHSFFAREGDAFIEMSLGGDRLASRVVTGFVLDIAELRRVSQEL